MPHKEVELMRMKYDGVGNKSNDSAQRLLRRGIF